MLLIPQEKSEFYCYEYNFKVSKPIRSVITAQPGHIILNNYIFHNSSILVAISFSKSV